MLVLSFIALVFIVIYSLLSIETREFKIPVRYSGYREGNLSNRGEWYSLLILPLFSLASFVINSVLGLRVHRMRPELSHVILGLNLVVAVFTFLVAKALFDLL